MTMKRPTSWGERFALLDHYKPSDTLACKVFGVTQAELEAAQQLRAHNVFASKSNMDVDKYAPLFGASPSTPVVNKPESASKREKLPLRRGRKGDKITRALLAVPASPVDLAKFAEQQGVSLAVLRQSKRFVQKLDGEIASAIGTINVRKDKSTNQLVIWRDPGVLPPT